MHGGQTMTHQEIAKQIEGAKEQIVIIYAFNSTGKTRVSEEYKEITKAADGAHAGVYYNARSEDIFVWDNGDGNDDGEIQLNVRHSSLSKFHSLLNEDNLREKLKPYKPRYNFEFRLHGDAEEGIDFVSFFPLDAGNEADAIKISRGEERIFVWCFFLALFEVEGWADQQNRHFFIDDPVSSLDDHNIFITASTILDLIDKHFKKRKIIITTHHIGLFSILFDWLKKGEKSGTYSKATKLLILTLKDDQLSFKGHDKDVFLYHLHLLQILREARDSELKAFHFALLRQVLENVASFLGVGRVGYVLEQLDFKPEERVLEIVNFLSHKNVYRYESQVVVPDNMKIFQEIFDRLMEKYKFVLHAPPAAMAAPATAAVAAPVAVPVASPAKTES
jgi:AAA domain